jgi:hypothetical protein
MQPAGRDHDITLSGSATTNRETATVIPAASASPISRL